MGINNIVRIRGLMDDGTVIIYSRLFNKILEGKAFSVSHRFEGISADASADIFFENPSGSTKNIFIVAVEVGGFGAGWVDIYRDNTVSSSGTQLTPTNLNLSSTNSSVANVEYGGTYTVGTLAHQTVLPGGTLVRSLGSIAEVGENVVLPPNNNFLVRITNKSGTTNDYSIRIIWWEE